MAISKQTGDKNTPPAEKSEALAQLQNHPPIIHAGSVKNKHAKKLKRGSLNAMSYKVNQKLQDVKANVEGRPVIISYEEKPRKKPKKKKKVNFMGFKIDRKKFKKKMKKNGIAPGFL